MLLRWSTPPGRSDWLVAPARRRLDRGLLVPEGRQEGERKRLGVKRRLGQGGYGFFDLDGVHSSALVQLVQFDLEAIFVHADAFAGAVHQVLEIQRLGVQLA